MNLSYKVTEEAYLNFNIYHILHTSFSQRRARWGRFLTLLICIIPWCFEAAGRVLPTWFSVAVTALGLIWFVFYPAFYRKVTKIYCKRYIRDGNGKEFLGDQTLELLNDRIRSENKRAVGEVPYSTVERLVENEDWLYIYIGTMTAFIVPFTAFDGDHPYPEFRAYLEEKMRLAKTAAEASEVPSGASDEQ